MEIPLFPLHTVLCPGIVLPLHIFEERYRALVRHCLDTGLPFGVVLIRSGREVGPGAASTLAGVGAFAEIRRAGRYPDGRFDLLAAATGRFAIESVDAMKAPYLVADVTPLDEEVGDESRAERLSAAAIRRFVRYLELMRAREGETAQVLDIQVELDAPADADVAEDGGDALAAEGDTLESILGDTAGDDGEEDDGDDDGDDDSANELTIPDDPTVLSYLLSGIVQIELPRRQRLLEAETTEDRLQELVILLDREILLLGERLRYFAPDPQLTGGAVRS